MILKIFRVVWFLSVVAALGFFMWMYASLPDPIIVMEEPEIIRIGRETFFYIVLITLAIFNMFVYVFRALNKTIEGETFVSWYYGLAITLNLFMIVATSYVSLFNSGERFEYERIGIIIYGSIALMILWTIGWPVYSLTRKLFAKKAV
jgi:hypothetical protein